VCRHMNCAEIETDFIAWRSPAAIAKEYELSDRSSIYRHAHAIGLFSKRQRNIRAALERIIEKAGEVEVTAASVVAAVQAYSPRQVRKQATMNPRQTQRDRFTGACSQQQATVRRTQHNERTRG
jgi:hypothetical protein